MSLYNSINRKLFNLNFAKKSRYDFQGLQEIYQSLEIKNFPKVHVAGTNGKGSVVTKMAEAFSLSGYTCGSFTSPHIASYRERIQMNGHLISKDDFAKHAEALFSFLEERKIELTFFEVMTFVALKYFEEQKADVAVIEVGLGGRLDATNCITPILSIITSISFDHQSLLGDTLEKIASEKAGIIKENVPVLLGPQATQNSIYQKCSAMKAPFEQVSGNFKSYDEENQAIAKKALEMLQNQFRLSKECILKGILKRPPCRFQKERFLNRQTILDVSHNEEGLRRLFLQISTQFPQTRKVVFTSMAFNHDYASNLKIVEKNADVIYLLETSHPRLAKAHELKKACPSGEICPINQIKQKIESEKKETLILFTGSTFIMSDVYEILGLAIEKDSLSVNDGHFRDANLK